MLNGIGYDISPYSYSRSKPSDINFQKSPLKTIDDAQIEATNCLGCKNPRCEKACLAGQVISDIIKNVKNKRIYQAMILFAHNPFFGVLCQICSMPCETACVKNNPKKGTEGLNINGIEDLIAQIKKKDGIKFLLDKNAIPRPNGKKVAVVGSGIAGMVVASGLAQLGYKVFVFESKNVVGGQLTRTIPGFRLDKERWKGVIETVEKMGVKFVKNCKIGEKADPKNGKYGVTFDDLNKIFDSVCLCTGASIPNKPDIPGINLPQVFSADKFLELYNLKQKIKGLSLNKAENAKKVVVVSGGGNSAMDVARSAIKMGCKKVYVLYRRGKDAMAALEKEQRDAIDEGVEIVTHRNISKIINKGQYVKVKFKNTDPEHINPDDLLSIKANVVVYAHGAQPEVINTANGIIPITKGNQIAVDETHGVKEMSGIFACGDVCADIQKGGANAVSAVAAAIDTVTNIHKYLENMVPKNALKEANIKFRNPYYNKPSKFKSELGSIYVKKKNKEN